MSGMQNVSFGSLTAKSVNQANFSTLDQNKDGIISEEELMLALGKEEFDLLDLSSIDKDADTKVTQKEYDLWQQESEMAEYLKTMKDQAARDMVGQSPEDITKLISKLTDFEASFKEEYLKIGKDVNKMSSEFTKEITKKYSEFKKDVLSNTKTVVVSRVINNVISDFIENDRSKGNSFLSLIDKNANSLSDNAKRLLSNELSREAEKFIKKYEGDNLEKDLAVYLQKYLATTDKEKLADAIGLWEKGKQELEDMPEEVKFAKLKSKAKNLLTTALESSIKLKVGDVYVRSEAAIPAAVGQFKDADSLMCSLDKAISELSSKTRAQEIKEQDEERRTAALEEAYKVMQKENEQDNIFK